MLELPSETFSSIAESYQSKQTRRDGASRVLQAAVRESTAAVHHLHRGNLAKAQQAITPAEASPNAAMKELGDEDEGARYGPLAGAMEAVIKAKAFAHFLSTGTLLPLAAVSFAAYDEYLPGVIGFANELQRLVAGCGLRVAG